MTNCNHWQILVNKVDGTKKTYTFNYNSPHHECITKTSSKPRKYLDIAGQIHDNSKYSNYNLHPHSDSSGTLMYTADEKLDEDSDGTCSWLDSSGHPEICDYCDTTHQPENNPCCPRGPSGEVPRCKDVSHAECEFSYMKVSESYVNCSWVSASAPTPSPVCTGVNAPFCRLQTDPSTSLLPTCIGKPVKNIITTPYLACSLQLNESGCKNSYYIDNSSHSRQCYWD